LRELLNLDQHAIHHIQLYFSSHHFKSLRIIVGETSIQRQLGTFPEQFKMCSIQMNKLIYVRVLVT